MTVLAKQEWTEPSGEAHVPLMAREIAMTRRCWWLSGECDRLRERVRELESRAMELGGQLYMRGEGGSFSTFAGGVVFGVLVAALVGAALWG